MYLWLGRVHGPPGWSLDEWLERFQLLSQLAGPTADQFVLVPYGAGAPPELITRHERRHGQRGQGVALLPG